MAKYENLQEEEIKNKVARDYFSQYDSTKIIGRIDFWVNAKVVRGGGKTPPIR